MYLLENPVLQRELLVNLRMIRAFVLLFAYVGLLGLVVWVAWPAQQRLDLTTSEEAQSLVNLFFLGQYVLMSLMAPSFAGGSITGEKERRTYEMLLASPMRPGAIVLGKLLASLCHLAVLVFASLPIVMLCLPLGGVSLWEVAATYVAMAASVTTFGMICLTASSYFTRTVAALVVSYLIILPIALFGILFYVSFEGFYEIFRPLFQYTWFDTAARFRLLVLAGAFPAVCLGVCWALFRVSCKRLLHPPDVGSEAKEVVDSEAEQKKAVGMVIRSDQFPDKLFAPPKRTDLMADGTNPVYDKEMRSELFGQGTLMLRLVIQLSMFLALPLMAVCLYMWPQGAPWYTSYVLVFNMLVGPVFAAGTVTSERERQTLELLLCTTISPWQILRGKLLSSLRISTVLTSFLVWPLLLAWLLPPWTYWADTKTMLSYVLIIALSSLTTTTLAMFCSVVFRKTSVALMTAYLVLILLFAVPIPVKIFAEQFFPAPAAVIHTTPDGRIAHAATLRLTGREGTFDVDLQRGESVKQAAKRIRDRGQYSGVKAEVEPVDGKELWLSSSKGNDPARGFHLAVLTGQFDVQVPPTVRLGQLTFTSPFSAAFSLPLTLNKQGEEVPIVGNWPVSIGFLAFYLAVNAALLGSMLWLFNVRWRVRSLATQ
ncbi:MAG: ABC transporter permease subunit [Candidatus Nealsonbacteria bacterium]|nr:ABC transporter permease subunit [Candidatus Nealsonbacteria bacterium]